MPSALGPEEGLRRLQAAAQQFGLTCLDQVWRGAAARYVFVCSRGHSLTKHAPQLLYHTDVRNRCKQCLRDEQGARLAALAQARGGGCLEPAFLGLERKHRMACAAGHQWQARASALMEGSWCPQCALAHRASRMRVNENLERLHEMAAARGGRCLSTDYAGANTCYRFRCARGHEWETVGQNVLAGRWCKRCADDALRDTLEHMQAVAHERGGACLSTEYRTALSKLQWQCHRGHIWSATPSGVLGGHWCRQCHFLGQTRNPFKRRRYLVTET
jgi:hypothetical protein